MIVDELLNFGTITAVTKSVVAYSTNTIDFGNGNSTPTEYTTGHYPMQQVVFCPQADFASADSFTPQLYECDTENGTYTVCAQSAKVDTVESGGHYSIQLPLVHKRYLKAGILPASTGTLGSGAKTAMKVYCSRGAN